eukprot:TRINITY_DN7973_c0_g1_i3.p1 TRINITY_DN7973_c0_g1~~TRINITY_DN7973_c0_g1_i3.p1  ORF type:complete len:636 (-),score=70.32 TRINITY_DN7973_c0_g1_i3:162-1943(-)
MEAAFMREKRSTLQGTIWKMSAAIVVMLLLMVLASIPLWQTTSHLPRMILLQGGVFVVLLVTASSTFFIFFFRGDLPMLSDRMIEIVLTSIVSFASVQPYFIDGWYSSTLVGYDPMVEFTVNGKPPWFSDGRLILCVVFFLVWTHMILPLRWMCLLPLVILHECLYAFVVLGGVSPVPFVIGIFNLILFSAILIVVSVGKHKLEGYEREAAVKVISEKVLRCRSEFRVAQLEKSNESPTQQSAESASIAPSIPSTTNTGRIFQSVDAWMAVAELALKEQWLVQATELAFESEEPLGEGGFGTVVRAVYHGADVAVKFPWRSEETDHDHSHLLSLLNEMRILRHLRHPNIIGFVGACIDVQSGHVGLVLELVSGAPLDQYVSNDVEPVNDTVRVGLISTIQAGIEYLHSRSTPIVHGDLKHTNIVACARGDNDNTSSIAKILDFGLSRILTRNAKPLGGSFRWMAPEVARGGHRPALSADVFSFGKVVFFVASSALPNDHVTEEETMLALARGQVLQQQWPRDCVTRDMFETVVEICLEALPDQRPSIANVLQSLDHCQVYQDALALFNEALCGTETSNGPTRKRALQAKRVTL